MLLTHRQTGVLFALVTACGLGAITTLAKIVYSDGSNAVTMMLFRLVISTLVFGLILVIRRESIRVAKSQRLNLFLVGLIWTGGMICYLGSVETLSVSLAVLIFYTYPLLVLIYSMLRGQIKASIPLMLLFTGAFVGLYLALSGSELIIDSVGILFASLASAGAAFTFICGARVAPQMSPLVMTFWVNAVGLLVILPLLPGKLALSFSLNGSIALAAATLFYLIAIFSQFQGLERLPAAKAAFLLNLEPVVSILLAYLVINELLSTTQWAGVIMVIGVVLLSLKFQPADT